MAHLSPWFHIILGILREKMDEKITRWVLLSFCVVLLIGGAVLGWLLNRSLNRGAEMARRIDSLTSLSDSYLEGIRDLSERYRVSEAERERLDARGRELEAELQSIIDGIGGLDDGLLGVESSVRRAGEGVREADERVSGVAGRLQSYIKEAQSHASDRGGGMGRVGDHDSSPDLPVEE